MNPVSHDQAVRWIQRRLDRPLTEEQRSLLEEHLQACEVCRVYAAESDMLATRLQKEFHARWDETPGPSKKVMDRVTAKAAAILLAKQINSGVRLLAGAVALVVLGLAINFFISRLQGSFTKTETGKGPVSASLSADDRLLVFHSDENGNYDIYSMHADGSGLTNLTHHPANDKHPFWSPDGTRIAFESDRSGTVQIFLMNADGSGLIQLTGGESQHMFLGTRDPWSPDGTSLLIGENTPSIDEPENQIWTLYATSIDGQTKASLIEIIHTAPTSTPWLDPSWGPGGQHIAFTMDDPATEVHTSQLYIVDADGSNLTNTTSSLPANEIREMNYYWSRDGQSIFFIAYRQVDSQKGQRVVYEFDLADSQPTEKAATAASVVDWWEGTSFSMELDVDYTTIQTAFASIRKASLKWLRADGSSSALQPFEKCEFTEASDLDDFGVMYQRSLNGNLIIFTGCPRGDWWLYRANPDGTVITQLLNAPIVASAPSLPMVAWSPDDRYITFFSGTSDNLTDVYLLDVEAAMDDPSIRPVKVRTHTGSEFYSVSWQPVWNNEVVEEKPRPINSPEVTDLPTLASVDTPIATDAPTLVLTDTPIVTDTPTLEPTQPATSQEHLIAFASAGENGNSDIYTMRPDGSELTNLTNDPAHDLKPFWSLDGKRIAFESDRNGNDFTQIFLMNADGSDVFQVTNGEVHHQLVSNSWSPDGSRLIFIEWDPANEKMALYIIGTDGENKTFLAQVPVSYSYPSWSPDGEYVAFVSRESQDMPTVSHLFVVDKNGDHLIRLAESLPADEDFIPSSNYHWSQDGKSIFFIAESHSSPDKASIVYEAGLDGSLTAMTTANKPILDWWNGTALGLAEHGTTLTWLRSDGSQATLGLCRSTDQALGMAYARSHNGDLVFGSNCSARGWLLYWANSDGTLTDKLPDLGIPSRYDILDMTWSPDGHFLAFIVHDTDSPVIGETLYILDVAQARRDPSVQPVKIASNYGGTSWQPVP